MVINATQTPREQRGPLPVLLARQQAGCQSDLTRMKKYTERGQDTPNPPANFTLRSPSATLGGCLPPWKTLVHSLALGGPTTLNGVQSEKTRKMRADKPRNYFFVSLHTNTKLHGNGLLSSRAAQSRSQNISTIFRYLVMICFSLTLVWGLCPGGTRRRYSSRRGEKSRLGRLR